MLIDQTVTSVVPDKLNGHIKFILAAHAIFHGGHLRATHNRIRPQEHRNTGLNRIFQRRHTYKRDLVGTFAGTGIATVNAHVASKDRQHRNCTGCNFSVSVTLRAPTLRDKCWFCLSDFTSQLDDFIHGDARDFCRPFRRFRYTVWPFAENISLVMRILRHTRR
ncbi:hypothetical protein SRABI106_04247 [Rahnella aquatilis]|nr:hypothetical protein SRABI106_04247 [Rahnella aquatilis]